MIIRTTTKRLAILAFHFFDGQIVDASKTPGHKTVAVKFPILVPVGSKPVATIIVPFVSKADCNSIFMKSPELLNESIVQFPSPLMGEKLDNCLTAGEKLQTITPYAVRSVGAGQLSGSRLFQASSASQTFFIAESRSKGGIGRRLFSGVVISRP